MADPFRLVTELTGCDADGAEAVWCPTGSEFGVLGEVPRPSEVPCTLVFEAMTQCAGPCRPRRNSASMKSIHWHPLSRLKAKSPPSFSGDFCAGTQSEIMISDTASCQG